MSNRLANPNPQFFDNSGQPLNGGVLRTYLTTTSTPAQTYSDAALTISNGSAITLDSAGRSPVSIFLDPAVTLKVTLETAPEPPATTGVVLWSRDPVVDLAANINASVQVVSGSPNGQLAGNAGTVGSTGASMAYDILNGIFYICTTTGNAASAVWTAIVNSFTGAEDIYTSTQTITAASVGRISTANNALGMTFNLTAAAIIGASKLFVFKNLSGPLTIDPNGTELIEGVADIVLVQRQSAICECTGSGWRVIAFYDGLMDTIGRTSFPSAISVVSAATCDVLSAASESVVITGIVTVTSFGTAPNRHRYCRSAGSFIITHDGTTLICPGAANITTAVGDTFEVISDVSGNVRIVSYQRASGLPVVTIGAAKASFCATNGTTTQAVASAASTAVTLGTELYDVGGFFATNAWTPPAGTALLIATVAFLNITAASTTILHILKNGTSIASLTSIVEETTMTISVMDQCGGSDVYSMAVQSSDGNYTINDFNTSKATKFSGTML